MSVAVAIPRIARAEEIIHNCAALKDREAIVCYLHEQSGAMPIRIIPRTTEKYLERYFVGYENGVYNYLHRFVAEDADRAVHCHPWLFAKSTILTGSYKELHGKKPTGDQMPEYQLCEYHAQDENIITSEDVHQIIRTEPETWTCFQIGRAHV
jgi:hypothetical protein